jgi:23S rRNA (guanosine2251-2'-O)-methyltransferase
LGPESEDLVAGFHAVTAALEEAPDRVGQVWLDRDRSDARSQVVLALARRAGIRVQRVPHLKLDQLVGKDVRHQGVVARKLLAPTLDENGLYALLDGLDEVPFLLVLDEVQDPHNFGACLRTAEAAGVHAVVAPKDGSAPMSATVRKVASGSAERIPVCYVTNLARVLEQLKTRGIWVTGAAGDADKSLFDLSLTGPTAMVLGAEDKGLRRLTRSSCDQLAAIPMRGRAESLNVSVAAGVFLFEIQRQRRQLPRR